MSTTRDDVIAALREAGRPLTTEIVALQMGRSRGVVGSILSKLAAYGAIDRQRIPGIMNRFYYSAKPEARP
jgi:predicted transcriptional regulator